MTALQFAELVAKYKTTEEMDEHLDTADNNAIFDEVITIARQIVAAQRPVMGNDAEEAAWMREKQKGGE